MSILIPHILISGYDHFSNIQVFIDQPSCADGNADDVCNLEGYEFPCCHVHKGTDVKGYMTMISEEDNVENGLITCKVGVGEEFDHTCLEPEFCNGLNTTCPLAGPKPVKYNFAFSTDYWGRTHVSLPKQLSSVQFVGPIHFHCRLDPTLSLLFCCSLKERKCSSSL